MRMLLVGNGGIHIENDAGFTVGFKNLDELFKYSGVDLKPIVGKAYIGYEPDRGIHTAFDGINTVSLAIPAPLYDELIANVEVYASRKADPFYGLTGAALIAKQKEFELLEVYRTFELESEEPVEVTIPEGTFIFNGGQDSASYIQGAVGLAQALGETSVIITDINDEERDLSFNSAMYVAAMVGKAFRTAFLKKQKAKVSLRQK